MSALIKKSTIKNLDSKIFKGGRREKDEIVREVRTSGISENNFSDMLRKKYDYDPSKRKPILEATKGNVGANINPKNLSWEQRKRLSWEEKKKLKIEERKIEALEALKQKKIDEIEASKRAYRAKVSGKLARIMADEEEENRLGMISSNMKKTGKTSTKTGESSGFAGKFQSGSSGSGFAGGSSQGGFALGNEKGKSTPIRPL